MENSKTENEIIKISLGRLVNSQAALQQFLTIPKPIFYAMDLSLAIKKQIAPPVEAYFEQIKNLSAQFGGKDIDGNIRAQDFESAESAKEFFSQIAELQNKEVELNIKTISFAEIREYIQKSGIDAGQIFVGDMFIKLDWLIVEP